MMTWPVFKFYEFSMTKVKFKDFSSSVQTLRNTIFSFNTNKNQTNDLSWKFYSILYIVMCKL